MERDLLGISKTPTSPSSPEGISGTEVKRPNIRKAEAPHCSRSSGKCFGSCEPGIKDEGQIYEKDTLVTWMPKYIVLMNHNIEKVYKTAYKVTDVQVEGSKSSGWTTRCFWFKKLQNKERNKVVDRNTDSLLTARVTILIESTCAKTSDPHTCTVPVSPLLLLISFNKYVRCKYQWEQDDEYMWFLCSIFATSHDFIIIPKLSFKKYRHSCRERTLEHCLWFWHQTREPLFCKKKKKKKYGLIK